MVLPPEAIKGLEQYLSERGDAEESEPLFWGTGNRAIKDRISTRAIRARVSHYFEILGLKRKGITPYSLRQTAAILAIESGASVTEVMQMLRVKTLDTALVYFEEAKELSAKNKAKSVKMAGRKATK